MIKTLAKEYLHPLFKEQGFKKQNLVWTRRRGEFVDIFNVQTSQWSTAEQKSITGNYGICVPEFLEVIFGKSLSNINPCCGCIQGRIGRLRESEKPSDYWWDVDQSSLASVGEEIACIVRTKLFSIFDSIVDYDSIERYIENSMDPRAHGRMIPFNRLLLAMVRFKNHNLVGFREELVRMKNAWSEKVVLVKQWAGLPKEDSV